MRPRLAFALTALLFVAACSKGDASPPDPNAKPKTAAPDAPAPPKPVDSEAERAAVAGVFDGYKRAILAGKGAESTAFISDKTFAYYESMRVAALEMPAAEVRRAKVMDKLMILSLRARVARADLERWKSKELFVHAVDQGWIGDDVRDLEADEVRIDGDVAQIGIRKGATKVPPAMGFTAYREGGAWKLDIMSVRKIGEPALAAAMREIDRDEDRALLTVLGTLVDKKLDDGIWEPLAKGAQDKPR
jgi:hypothetical protein